MGGIVLIRLYLMVGTLMEATQHSLHRSIALVVVGLLFEKAGTDSNY